MKRLNIYRNIPKTFDLKENIVRSLYSPFHVKEGKIKPTAFKPPLDSEEISVNRLDYTNLGFLKNLSLKSQNDSKVFKGFARMMVKDIFDCNFKIVYSPLENNKFHSDILIGEIAVKGQPLSSEVSKATRSLANKSQFIDANS